MAIPGEFSKTTKWRTVLIARIPTQRLTYSNAFRQHPQRCKTSVPIITCFPLCVSIFLFLSASFTCSFFYINQSTCFLSLCVCVCVGYDKYLSNSGAITKTLWKSVQAIPNKTYSHLKHAKVKGATSRYFESILWRHKLQLKCCETKRQGFAKEEKHHRSDSREKKNKDGRGWWRLKRIGSDDFEKFSYFFFTKCTSGDVTPLKNLLWRGKVFRCTSAALCISTTWVFRGLLRPI